MQQLFDLSGRVALVSGANTGLGQAIAVALAQAGADIVAAGRSAADETAAQVAAAGRRFLFVEADFAGDAASVQQVAERLGYRNPANFSRAFQRWIGASPTAWRNHRHPRESGDPAFPVDRPSPKRRAPGSPLSRG